MARSVPKPRKISEFKPLFSKIAQTNHYQIRFGGFGSLLRRHLASKGVGPRFVGEEIGLLCNSAIIPGSSLSTAQVRGDFQGVVEKIAHTRSFLEMNLEFYVDLEYKSLKFLEHWIEFIASGSRDNSLGKAYNFRMRYPDEYKVDRTKIVKFEKDYDRFIEYTFIGLFPQSLNSTNVTYEGANLLKCSATFSYDRYISGETTSKSWWQGFDRNNVSDRKQNGSILSNIANSTINPVDWINRDTASRIFTDQIGSTFAKGLSAVDTIGGSFLGSGDSSTFELF